jgi:hypothetical protein
MKTIKILSVISLILFVSCGQKANSDKENGETATKTDEEKKKEIEQLERLQTLDIISKQFGASATFDTARFKMTYQYQNLIRQNDRVVIERFKITNIEKLDSNYIVSIEKGYSRKMFIEFICKQNQIERICPDIINGETINTRITDKFLILKINTIKKIKLKIDSYGKDNGEDEPTTYVELDASDAFICKGEFIDIYLKPKK